MTAKSSPHTRGCFLHTALLPAVRQVFPAYAGVFPVLRVCGAALRGLPRIRGGVSTSRDVAGFVL